MRIHTDRLTAADIHTATQGRGMTNVHATVSEHGSRSRSRAFEVKLTGNSPRRPNSGVWGGGDDGSGDYAATWDEWGMVLAALFAIDPSAIVGTAKRPTYNGRDHFNAVTAGRFDWCTAASQHRTGHRWTPAYDCASESCTARVDRNAFASNYDNPREG